MAGLALGALGLASANQWQYVGLGLMAIFLSPYIIPILMLPAGLFSYFMTLYGNAGLKGKEQIMFFLSIAYVVAFMTFWCAGIFYYVTYAAQTQTLLATVFWGSVVSAMPLLWWSSRDRENLFILTLVETAQLAVIVLALCRYFELVTSFWPMALVVAGIVGGFTGVQALCDQKPPQKTDASGS